MPGAAARFPLRKSHWLFLRALQTFVQDDTELNRCVPVSTESFFRNLVQRLKQLSQFYGEELPPDWGDTALKNVVRIVASCDTRVVQRARLSSRQNARLDYSGFTGTVVLRNVSADLFDLLRLGRLVGVGKNTVMGSGRYTISML